MSACLTWEVVWLLLQEEAEVWLNSTLLLCETQPELTHLAGIGLMLAEALVANGATVFICSRDASAVRVTPVYSSFADTSRSVRGSSQSPLSRRSRTVCLKCL